MNLRSELKSFQATSQVPQRRTRRRSSKRRDPVLERQAFELLRGQGYHGPRPVVEWNPRLRTTAGLACWASRTVTLNPRLLELPGEVQRTFRHELAHLLAQFRARGRRIAPHGSAWREACADLGIPGESPCHTLPFQRTRMERKYFYACRHCGSVLARVRRLRRAVACRSCCSRFNGGKYSEHFRFVPIDPPDQVAA